MPQSIINKLCERFDALTDFDKWKQNTDTHLLYSGKSKEPIIYPESYYEIDDKKVKTFLRQSLLELLEEVGKEMDENACDAGDVFERKVITLSQVKDLLTKMKS